MSKLKQNIKVLFRVPSNQTVSLSVSFTIETNGISLTEWIHTVLPLKLMEYHLLTEPLHWSDGTTKSVMTIVVQGWSIFYGKRY